MSIIYRAWAGTNPFFRLARELGISEDILKPLEGMFKQLRRRFVIGGGVGKPFSSTNGIMQGCPVSVILLNLLVTVWIRAVDTDDPSAKPFGFADDTGAIAHGEHSGSILQHVLLITSEYERLTGQRLNAGQTTHVGAQVCMPNHRRKAYMWTEQIWSVWRKRSVLGRN